MTLKNNRAPLLSNIKLYASFHHLWIQTGVTVRKRSSWVVTSVTLTFDLWPWPFAMTLPWSMVITPENFMMIRWWEHSQKGVTDRQTDGQTDRLTENTIHRAAWSQLKKKKNNGNYRNDDWFKIMWLVTRSEMNWWNTTSVFECCIFGFSLITLQLFISWQWKQNHGYWSLNVFFCMYWWLNVMNWWYCVYVFVK